MSKYVGKGWKKSPRGKETKVTLLKHKSLDACLAFVVPSRKNKFKNEKSGIFHFGNCPLSMCLLSEAFLITDSSR